MAWGARGDDALTERTLLGPFAQIVTMGGLPANGPLNDKRLRIVAKGGLLLEGGRIAKVLETRAFESMRASGAGLVVDVEGDVVALPGLVDSHTHMCYAGSRLDDYLLRLSGLDYTEIADRGGGIMSTVRATRSASEKQLEASLATRAEEHLMRGVTTSEVKSGYGLDASTELKMLRAIRTVDRSRRAHPKLVPTFLGAHVPPGGEVSKESYLDSMAEVLQKVREEKLAERVDAWVDKGAFPADLAERYLLKAKGMGFSITVHADQFVAGGSRVAVRVGAVSVDHLERSGEQEIGLLRSKGVAATVLPGSSMFLAAPFAPARKLLDAGLSLVIASDWNPGTAPSGDLVAQAAALAADQGLTPAETLAGITCRAARVLGLSETGFIGEGGVADLVCFRCERFEEVFYRQGALRPSLVVKAGRFVNVQGREG